MPIFLRFTKPDSQEIRCKTYEQDCPALISSLIAAGYTLVALKTE